MDTILICHKNAITKGIRIKAFISPLSSYNTLMLVGLSMNDLIALRDYQMTSSIANNCACVDLNIYNFSVLD